MRNAIEAKSPGKNCPFDPFAIGSIILKMAIETDTSPKPTATQALSQTSSFS